MVVVSPLHISMGVEGVITTVGVGLTVNVNVFTGPLQVFENGVTVNED